MSTVGVESVRFRVTHSDPATRARRGELETTHGLVGTPAFMPVATVAAVKGVSPADLRAIGTEIVLANSYHLHLRPGVAVVRALGDLSRFMGWNGPTLTDSGGFQVFSLAELVRVGDDGVEIRSHLDGSVQHLTPESVVRVQEDLGVDVMMPLDDCPPYPASPDRLRESVERTGRWLARSVEAWRHGETALFGIVQGGTWKELRSRSAESALAHDLPGYAVGGLSVGEPRDLFYEIAAGSASHLPSDRLRYLMGAGTPEDLLRLIGMGYDLFDCVLPTRNGRNGSLFTSAGRLNIRNARFAADPGPPDPECHCPVCTRFSRAYLRHLAVAGEMLSGSLNSIHNLAFYQSLMRGAREALEQGSFPEYTSRTLQKLVRENSPE